MATEEITTTNFLTLPRELRDIIYKLALVPSEPIEFAPINYGTYFFESRDDDFALTPDWYFGPLEDDFKEGQSFFIGASWHRDRYIKDIQPSLALLRTSKQIYAKASEVYYGQEFRFSNTFGCYFLGKWLKLIGPVNGSLLRHITASHPGVESKAGSECHSHLALSPLPHHHPIPPLEQGDYNYTAECWYCAEDEKYASESEMWQMQRRQENPIEQILNLTNLRTLRFVIFNQGVDRDRFSNRDWFADQIARHAPNKAVFSRLPNTKLSLLNLKAHFGGTDYEISLNDPRFNKSYSSLGKVENWKWVEPEQFFYALQAQGWTVEEAAYDNHFTYPVQEEDHCVNRRICEYLRNCVTVVGTENKQTGRSISPEEVQWLQEAKDRVVDPCCRRTLSASSQS